MELEVTVQIDGSDVRAGILYAHARRGVESASFRYDGEYLSHLKSFPLAPDMPLTDGSLHTQGEPMFRVFEDCMPDRWGRNLMLRAERRAAREEGRAARTLLEADYLAGVSDEARQGALRLWHDGVPVADAGGVPREVRIPDLLAAADRAAEDLDADVGDLVAAGSSLGGARPKASVIDEWGALNIAKFPKADELPVEDACAWEKTALDLAGKCGIRVPNTRLLRVGGRSVLLLERFDREGPARIPYLSGLTAVQGNDGGRYSYLDLVSFLESEGSSPGADIAELWRRILFSCAIGNTDDHMRNHGFLREASGWRLSPAFDVNPTPGDNSKFLRSAIDFENDEALPEAALSACEWYRLDHGQAVAEARKMARVLKGWRKAASANGIPKASIEYMASCFEAAVGRLNAVR
ncbi:MAG: type II toxin-antitoxin system HipA family toxin [Eggerthellaceae bacterium]|nr:type II toxin-antitoxin system HipA family toxin [Eggerthellaceae bacterium]